VVLQTVSNLARKRLRKNKTARRLKDEVNRRSSALAQGADLSAVEIPHPFLFVGAHHKTGTVWLTDVFERFAQLSRASYYNVREDRRIERERPREVLFDHHCTFQDFDISQGRGFRMVRDPRDVLISAMHYHRRGSEAWLHRPRADGRTYVETVNALSDEDALLFEIDENSGKTIREMLAFDGGDTVKTIHYEDYIDDANMEQWFDLLLWSGLRSADLILGQQALYENSLFGLKQKGGHVRSGKKQQWREKLSDKVLSRLDETFPGAIEELGYE
jgi:hypothetical protein